MRALGGKPSLGERRQSTIVVALLVAVLTCGTVWLAAIIAQLVEHGAKVDGRDVDGNTPFHLAISEGHEDIARYLLEHGAGPSAKNNEGKRCVDLAKPAFQAELHAFVSEQKGVDNRL